MKRVYTFGDGKAEGNAEMRNLLGGKGANLAEMNLLGMPVPPGFTITTEVCNQYTASGRDEVVRLINDDVRKAISHVEALTGKTFNDPKNPLLVSVRSGARASMPGMMDTVLNLGMNDATVESLSEKSGNPRFAWDSYRRFVQMYGDVVLGMKPKTKTEIDPFEAIIEKIKEEKESSSIPTSMSRISKSLSSSSRVLSRITPAKISLKMHGISFGAVSALFSTAG